MSPRMLPLPFVIGFALLGCGGNVVLDASTASSTGGAGGLPTGSSGAGGAGGSSITMGSGAGGMGAGSFALVTTSADPNGPCLFDSNPPNSVFVIVASQPITCAETAPPEISMYGTTLFSGFAWEVCFALAPEDLVPGTLSANSLSPSWGNSYESDVDGSTPCEQSGVLGGTLTITAVQSSSVTFLISGTDQLGCDLSHTTTSDGTYTAPRCP